MRKFAIALFCLLTVALSGGHCMAENSVLVVTSASEEGCKNIGTIYTFFEGIEAVLKTKGVTPEYLYLDLDTAADDSARTGLAKPAIEKVKKKKPKVVVTVGDNAIRFIGTRIETIPVVFGFIYGDLQAVGLPKANMTGVTRGNYLADIYKLSHKLTGANTIALLSKDNTSMAGIKALIMANAELLERHTGVKTLDMYLVNTFEDWQKKVQSMPAQAICLADTSRLLKKDGKEATRLETVQWTIANSKVPVVASGDTDVEAGALFSIIVSDRRWGEQTGAMVAKILDGTPVDAIPIESVVKGALHINTKTAEKYDIAVPYDLLSVTEKVYD